MGDDKLLNETGVPLCSLVSIDNGKQIKGKWDYESVVWVLLYWIAHMIPVIFIVIFSPFCN